MISHMNLTLKTLRHNKYRLCENVVINGVTIPKGFETDFASIPKWAWSLVGHPTEYRFQRASLYHDYLLSISNTKEKRRKSHKTFLSILIEDKVNVVKAFIMYLAVNISNLNSDTSVEDN